MYCFDSPDDQLDTLNKIILECIERHAPLKRTKFTRPPAPWQRDLDMVALQNQRNKLRYKAHSRRTISAWVAYRKVKNEIKQKIITTKTLFYKNILNSKNAEDMWKVIHRILNPKSTTLEGNVNDINKFCSRTARIAGKEPVKTPGIYRTITSLPENSCTEQFELQTTNYDEVLKIICPENH